MLGIESGFYSLVFISFMFFISVAGMAFFWGLFSFFTIKITKKISAFWVPLVGAGVFVLAEYLSAWGYGIIWFGDGSLLGAHWTLGNPAYFFASSEFILKTASVWGIYGIDFLLAWTAGIIFLLINKTYAIRSKVLLLNLALILSSFFLTTLLSIKNGDAPKSQAIKVALIQTKNPTKPQYPLDEVLKDYTQKLELIKEAAKSIGEGIIVFPESSNFSQIMFSFLDSGSIKDYFDRLSAKELVIIDNNILPDQENYKSRTLFINSKNGSAGFYDKQLLTPAGEYLPYLLKLLLFSLGEKSTSEDSGLKPGTHSELLSYGGGQLKTLACSDVLSPSISSQGRYGFLVSLQNLGIFKGSREVESQFLSILRFRAAENGKYAILASNYGHSYVINPDGNIEKKTDSYGYQILTAEVVPNEEWTWYNKLGDLPILLLSLAVFCLGLRKFWNDK